MANNAIQIPLSDPFPGSERRGKTMGECIVADMSSFYREFDSIKIAALPQQRSRRYSFNICSGDVCITKSPVEPFTPY